MSRQVMKKPNGKYAVWSTIVDDFIFDDINKEEYIKFRLKEEKERALEHLQEIFEALDSNKPREIYYQFTMTYEEALEMKKKKEKREKCLK